MLILLVRLLFVLLATSVGWSNGGFFYRPIFDGAMPPWFGAAIGFGVSVTLIAAEQAFRRRFTRSLVAFLIGLAGGLGLSILLLLVLHLVIQDRELASALDVPMTLVVIYLVLVTVLRNVDRWRLVLPFVELKSDEVEGSVVVLDESVLADGRLAALARTGFLAQRLLLHRDVLAHWEKEAAAGDESRQRKGRRALEILTELRALNLPSVVLDETELPNARDRTDALIRLCRLEGARLLSNDRDAVRRAQAEGVQVIDLAALANILTPPVRVGDTISVLIERPGEGRGQGTGHLDDGSLVVVNNSADRIGQRVQCTVIRLHNTSNGRMVFAEREAKDDEQERARIPAS